LDPELMTDDRRASVEAVAAAAVEKAREIVQGETDPATGARALWTMGSDLRELTDALREFAGLASAWEDEPKHRAAYESDIVVAADGFMARFAKQMSDDRRAVPAGCERTGGR
jgi:hypothetical protein